MTLYQSLKMLYWRELLLAWRRPGDIMNALLFFVIVTTLFPLAVTPDPQLIRQIAPGVIWVTVCLTTFLSAERLFRDDVADGSLEQWLLSPHSLSALMLVKVIVNWQLMALPLVLISPLLGLMLHLQGVELLLLPLSLLLGSISLSFMGAIGAALTLNLRGGGVLLALLVLPLYIPILVFGAGTLVNAQLLLPVAPLVLLLLAACIFTLSLAPLAIAGALRVRLMN